MQKTVCELFAWVWWFRVWLESANNEWKTVWANQREPGKKSQYAFDCYVANFWNNENYVNEDISSVNKKKIPDHNLLVWWFPCQDYSVAHTWAQWIQGKKWVLWRQIREILIAKKPSFVLLENVDRLLKSPASQRWRDFWVILACFNDLWYSVERRVINAAEYWCTQRRRRTFIFAYKNTTKYWKALAKESFEDILHDNGFFYKQFPIEQTVKWNEIEFKYEDLADVSENFDFEFENAWVMRKWKIYTEDVTPCFEEPIPLKEIIEKNVDDKYKIKQDIKKWTYLKWAKDIIRKAWTPQEYHFREWAIAFPDPLDRPARTMLTSEWSLNRSTHVIQGEDWDYRILTPIECERINWFPDNWTKNWWMPERFRYFVMWNALVVKLITRMWYRLDEIFENED